MLSKCRKVVYAVSVVARILLRGARARVQKLVVTKSSRSESHLALGLRKRIWLKFSATACHCNWWLWRSNFALTELGRKISSQTPGGACAPCLATPLHAVFVVHIHELLELEETFRWWCVDTSICKCRSLEIFGSADCQQIGCTRKVADVYWQGS